MDKSFYRRLRYFVWSPIFVACLLISPGQKAQIGDSQLANNNYFVANYGDDSNPGVTREQPWRTIQKAADFMIPGDTVTVLPGTYDERIRVTVSGNTGAPITYQTEGTVAIQGFTVAADYITIKGFDISNTADDWKEGWGIFVEGSYCLIKENYVHYATRGGIRIWTRPGNESNTTHCIVRNNQLYRNAIVGIEVHGINNLIEGNEIWGTIQYHPNWIDPPNSVDADGIRFFGTGHTIRKNYIHDINYGIPENVNPHIDCFQTWGNVGYAEARNILFEMNVCENKNAQIGPGEIGKGFMLENSSNILIRNNIIQAFSPVHSNNGRYLTIINNILSSDLSLYTTYGPIGITLYKTPDSVIMNNIFYDLSGRAVDVTDSESQLGLKVGFNCVYRSDGVMPSGTPYPNDLWDVNPMFINPEANNFHLLPQSPVINAGITLGEVIDDFDGNPRPIGEGYDIGAYEYPFVEDYYLPYIIVK